jgi:hypothetical protein
MSSNTQAGNAAPKRKSRSGSSRDRSHRKKEEKNPPPAFSIPYGTPEGDYLTTERNYAEYVAATKGTTLSSINSWQFLSWLRARCKNLPAAISPGMTTPAAQKAQAAAAGA